MKGLAHFLTGLALATFFPEVVHAAEAGSLLPVLGGLGGLLPDTLDFKFVQFWENYDVEVDPGPEPDAEAIAETVVKALNRAHATSTPIHLKAHTIRLSADSWRRYTLEFLPDEGEITVSIGPVVTTGQTPYAGTEPAAMPTARRKVAMPLLVPYAHRYDVDIFHGPSFLFVRSGESVSVSFLDWHHRWTHSLLLAPVVGVCIALVVGCLFNWSAALWAGIVSWIGFSAHVLEDQLGYMGCNLWWPLSRSRKPGVGLFHAGDALPNFITVWLSLVLMLFNLDRYALTPYLPRLPYLLFGVGGPLVAVVVALLWRRRHTGDEQLARSLLRSSEILAETKGTIME